MRGLTSFTSTSEHPGKGFKKNSNTRYNTAANNVVPRKYVLENKIYDLKYMKNTEIFPRPSSIDLME